MKIRNIFSSLRAFGKPLLVGQGVSADLNPIGAAFPALREGAIP